MCACEGPLLRNKQTTEECRKLISRIEPPPPVSLCLVLKEMMLTGPAVAALLLTPSLHPPIRLPGTRAPTPLASLSRRNACTASFVAAAALSACAQPAVADKAYQPALAGKDYGKSEMSYEDFTRSTTGLLFKDAKTGNGKAAAAGDRVVIDWTGYTIGCAHVALTPCASHAAAPGEMLHTRVPHQN
jgi:hypothetical protein